MSLAAARIFSVCSTNLVRQGGGSSRAGMWATTMMTKFSVQTYCAITTTTARQMTLSYARMGSPSLASRLPLVSRNGATSNAFLRLGQRSEVVAYHPRWITSSTTTTSATQRNPPTPVVAAVTTASSQSWWSKYRIWHRIATIIRYVRIPILVVSVYALGHQQGVIDCTKQPVALQRSIFQSILLNTGVDLSSSSPVTVVSEKEAHSHSRDPLRQVASVGHKIITTARSYVHEQAERAVKVVYEQKPDLMSQSLEIQKLVLEQDEMVQFWLQAQLRLDGEKIDQQNHFTNANESAAPWHFVFLESPSPNAFVTEILPQKFFITSSLLHVATTPDEWAVVLGHEISHLILGHNSTANQMETMLRTVEVLLLSMDPTAGLISVFVMGLLYAARKAVSAAYSRDHEREADELGLQLAAAACFDTKRGSFVMYKMHQATSATPEESVMDANPATAAAVLEQHHQRESSVTGVATSSVLHLMDTHPATLDRWERLERAADNGENYTKYPHCATITRRFYKALWSQ